jgi:hypothetical protein
VFIDVVEPDDFDVLFMTSISLTMLMICWKIAVI